MIFGSNIPRLVDKLDSVFGDPNAPEGWGADNDAAGGWGGYDSFGYNPNADNPNIDSIKGEYYDASRPIAKTQLWNSLPATIAVFPSIAAMVKGSKDIDALHNDIATKYGQDVATQVFKSVDADFAKLNRANRPDKLSFMKQSVLPVLPSTKKEMDKLIESIHQPVSTSGRDAYEGQKWLDYRTDMYSDGRARWDRSQEIGLPNWYKEYLRVGKIPEFMGGGMYETDRDGNRINADPASSTGDSSAQNNNEESNMATKDKRPSLWDQYLDSWYADENNVKDIINADAEHKRQAGLDYQNTITDANDKQSGIINDILDKVKNEEGMYKPVSFTINGEPVSFVNRGARNTGNFVMNAGQNEFNNAGNTATGIFGTSDVTSPSTGAMAYLDALSKGAGEEEAIRAQEVFEKYRQDALDKGIAIDQQNANTKQDIIDPSFLDKTAQVASAGKGVFDLFSAGKSLFGF